MEIAIINGPNLNLLGKRETDIYGDQDFESYFKKLENDFGGHRLIYFQSNSEGSLIDHIHEIGFSVDGMIINPGGYSHTSVAIADALAAVTAPSVEVHISNIFSRETFRSHSYISPVAKGVISGLGLEGYRLAIEYLLNNLR